MMVMTSLNEKRKSWPENQLFSYKANWRIEVEIDY
jgi:hypothetical protein